MNNLTSQQFDELIEQYVKIQVNNMDYGSLVEWVTEEMQYQLSKYNQDEIKDDIDRFDDGLYEELINNICSDDKLTNRQL